MREQAKGQHILAQGHISETYQNRTPKGYFCKARAEKHCMNCFLRLFSLALYSVEASSKASLGRTATHRVAASCSFTEDMLAPRSGQSSQLFSTANGRNTSHFPNSPRRDLLINTFILAHPNCQMSDWQS